MKDNLMTIDSEDIGDVKVVRFGGDLDTHSSPEGEEFLADLVAGGASKILIDFKQLGYVSSAGLRLLLATAKKLRATDGTLRLCGLNETVKEVFEISGFISILNVFKTEDEAMAGF